ncbi:LysR substrate-binding domain-containing protein [Bordetella genomosp. 13]|uniref:LysR substrate-binding domain-containing protein n=1 Tax=Bordetella genomosp. 13 TaxID=463040 RepID=UPI001643327D|nr:LysR substrate-binding domain-containing protein [Bordetella genomosp. 13]
MTVPGSPLDLRLLRHFVVLAEELHFGRAAQRLNISQPPLSKQVQQLEERLGVALFDRDRRSVRLTPAGETLAREARRLLAQSDLALRAVQSATDGHVGRVRIGFVPAALFMEVEQAFRDIGEQLPGIQTAWEEMSSAEQVQALLQDRIDLGFAHAPQGLGAMASRSVARVALVAALPERDPLAHAPSLRLADLCDHAFVSLPREVAPGFHDLAISVCLSAGFSPRIQHYAHHFLSIISLISMGQGVGILPQSLQRTTVPGVVFKPLSDVSEHAEYSVIWNPRNRLPAVERILALLGVHAGG